MKITKQAVLSTVLFFIFLTFLFSCFEKRENIECVLLNDTTEVIKLVFEKAYKDNLLAYDSVVTHPPFQDSIIFTYDSLLLLHFPLFDNVKPKLMTKNEMCDYISKQHIDSTNIPLLQYTHLDYLAKTDSSFEIKIGNSVIFPAHFSDGQALKKLDGSVYQGKEKCDFINRKRVWYRIEKNDNEYVISQFDVAWN